MSDLSPIFSSLGGEDLQTLLQRAARLREKQAEEGAAGSGAVEDGGWVAEFSLGGQAYALPLAQVLSCQPLKGVASVPMASKGVIGILRFQGKVIRVLSLASLLGSRGWRRDPAVLLILKTGHEELAVDCEEIPRVSQLPMTLLSQAMAAADSGVQALSLPGGKLLRFLSLETLLAKAGH